MITLFLQPTDVWLFRDGRPFSPDSGNRAESLFPPYPSVVQGAIRSHYLSIKGVDLSDKAAIKAAVGDAENFKTLQIRGPFLARREGDHYVRYYPQPADAVTVDRDKHTLRPTAAPRRVDNGVMTSQTTELLMGLEEEPTKPDSGLWLCESHLMEYLVSPGGKDAKPVTGVPSKCLFEKESRFGIGRDLRQWTTIEGRLYEVEFIRPHPHVGLLIDLDGYPDWPKEPGNLKLGGEGRGASFKAVQALDWPKPPDPLPGQFKVYFATPTYFAKGWQPETWSKFFDGQVTLVSAAVARFESLGGYDRARDEHKAARRYVPAGSVYYFKASGEASLKPGLLLNAITDYGAAIGFGQIIITAWGI